MSRRAMLFKPAILSEVSSPLAYVYCYRAFFTTMNKGLTILARLGTSERMVVFIDPTQNDILKIINEKYGKDWVKVNELCVGDVLRFDAEQIYRGFDPQKNDDNYCEGCLEQGVLKEYVKPKLYA